MRSAKIVSVNVLAYSDTHYKVVLTPTNEIEVDRYVQSFNKTRTSFKIRADASSTYMDWLAIGY